jgi:DNA-binding phage protein
MPAGGIIFRTTRQHLDLLVHSMLYEILSSGCAMKSTTVGQTDFRLRLSQVLARFSSVAALAREIGVSDNAIYKWLAGRGQPSVSNLVALSRTAGVSLEWLATGREPGAVPAEGSRMAVGSAGGTAAKERSGTAPRRVHGGTGSGAPFTKSKSAGAPSRTDPRGRGARPVTDTRVPDARQGGAGAQDRRATLSLSSIHPGRGDRGRDTGAEHAGNGAARNYRARDDAAAGARDREWAEPGDGAEARRAAAAYEEYTFPPHRRASAPNGSDRLIRSEQVVNSLAFKTEWLRRRLATAPHNLMLVEVVGDAMAPTLHDSDLILVDLSEPRFQRDGVYVLRRDGELEVKRLQRGSGGNLIIKSDNAAYDSTVVARDRVGVIGRVIWAAGRI